MSNRMHKPREQKRIVNREYHFGACPYCGESDVHLNNQNHHWAICLEHRTMWHIGCGLFSGWKQENDEIWARNRRILSKYRIVKPLPMECDFDECDEEQDEDDEEQDEDDEEQDEDNHGWL